MTARHIETAAVPVAHIDEAVALIAELRSERDRLKVENADLRAALRDALESEASLSDRLASISQ